MNYTTGEPINLHSECVCESPRGSIPVKNAPPALPAQLTYLTEKVGTLADRVNRLSLFLTDTTMLVLTQIVRVTQNAIQLHRMDKRITKDLAWIKDNDISERDFEVQREVYYLLLNKLRDHPDESGDVTEW